MLAHSWDDIANPDLPYDAIFFDFDGVLVDSVDVKTRAFCELYADYGPDIQDTVIAHHLKNGGISRFDKIRFFETEVLGHSLTEEQLTELCERFADIVKKQVIEALEIPGAQRMLESLAGICPLFVVSGTPQGELEEIVHARQWSPFFHELRGSPKPKDHHLIELLEAYSLSARQCLMVGDAETDRKAASLTGVSFVGVRGRDGQHPFPKDVSIVNDMEDFLERNWEAAL